jgi:nitroreductase
MASPIIDFMLARTSAPIHDLKGPEPSQDDIDTMLRVASRVPDHGALAPWRFILYRGAVRLAIGESLVALAERLEGPLPEGRKDKERTRFSRAPLVIGVVCSPKPHPKIPEWEMFLSAGAAAMNLLIAANALGYGANWISNWYAEVEEGHRLLGVGPGERIVGFVHIGHYDGKPMQRPRPDIAALWTDYSGPWGD